MQALANLKVLDLTRVLAGPWATQILADFGADVIKVERPGTGDDTRAWGPPWFTDEQGNTTGESAYFMCANRGKKSVCLDINSAQGQAAIRSLAMEADVLVENFKVGGAAKYGLDYPSLAADNPRLVYCSITGFGQTGPLKDRPGYDFMIQAMGGLMSITGAENGEPQKTGVALTDIMTGLYATIGILTAVHERAGSGLGQHIDLALLDVTTATLANQASNYLVGGITPQRMGNAHPNIVPYQSFPVADGHLVIAVGNNTQFERLCASIGLDHLAEDKRYSTNASRVEHRASLVPLLESALRKDSRDNWLHILEQAGIPCSPINNIDDVFAHPQIAARDMTVSMTHGLGGTVDLVGNPIKLSRTPPQYQRPPPLLGQDAARFSPTGDGDQ